MERLLTRFDFAACHQHMEETGWKWGWGTREYTPTIDEMRETVRVLASDAARDRPTGEAVAECGGFRVARDADGRWAFRFRRLGAADAVAQLSEADLDGRSAEP